MIPETNKTCTKAKTRTHESLYSHPAGCWRHASLQPHTPTPPQELHLACSLHQRRPRSWEETNIKWDNRINNNKRQYRRRVKRNNKRNRVSVYPGFAGLSGPFPTAIQRHSSMFPGPLEQILHHLIGALLLGRPNDLLPTALWSPSKKPAKV